MSEISVPIDGLAAAWQKACPGDRLVLEAGCHAGGIKLPSCTGGAAGAPITITGPGAVIDATGKPYGIECLGGRDITIDGVEVIGGVNGLQFCQSGSDFTRLCARIIARHCRISGCKEDGIKISQCDDARVIGNTISGCGQQCIDYLDVLGGEITGNDCSDAHIAAAICAKGGSRAFAITGNKVHDVDGWNVAAIQIGGYTDTQYVRPAHRDCEARGIGAMRNEVRRVKAQAINFLGAVASSASINDIESVLCGVTGKDCSWHAIGVAPNAQGQLSTDITVKYNTYRSTKARFGLDKRQDMARDRITFLDGGM